MKKIITLVALFLVILGTLKATETRHTYTFGAPEIYKTGSYQLIGFDHTLQTGLPGEPTLPYCKVSLLLPPGETATRIEYEWANEVTIPGTFVLLPQQQVRPLSKGASGDFIRNETIYRADLSYPGIPGGQLLTSFLNGRSVALSSFTPVRYNPATGSVSYYTSVTVTVVSTPEYKSTQALSNLRNSKQIESLVGRFADNPGASSTYAADNTNAAGDYQVLIITTNAFINAFDELVSHYLTEGLIAEIATTEDINASGSGADLQEKIRNYIIDEYQQHGVEHVILGGDDELIPHRGFYCYVQSGSGYQDQNIPADLYYSALDGNWNTDGDNQWGEPGEDDLLPDISVGRMPFSNLNELNAMINKSISYQFDPVMGEMRKVLMAGEELYGNPYTVGSQYLELLIGDHDDNGYSTVGIPESYTFDKLYDEVSYWSKDDLMAHLNQGNPMLHHSGHANETYVMKFSNGDITNANFAQLDGSTHNYTLVYTHGCLCGAFDYSDCIAEKMVTINNFAAVFVGNSRYGWFNEGQTEGPSAHLHREFIDALYADEFTRVGRAHMESKIATMPWVTAPGQWEPGALRWCFYDCNVLGDPVMAVWTDNPFLPNVSYSQAITVGSATTTVTVQNNSQPAPGVTCAIVKNNQVVGKGTTNSSGIAFVTFDPVVTEPGEALLFVSGGNCKPASYPVDFIPATGAYVIYQSVVVNDATGNQDGIPDYGETVSLSLTLQNNGVSDATDVSVTLSSSDPYINITDATELYPSIPAGSWVTIDNGFSFTVSDTIPDMHELIFEVTATSGTSWYSGFSLVAHAPRLISGDMSITNESLHVNGRLDPGEDATINIPLSNLGHSDCSNITVVLNTSNSFVSIVNPVIPVGNLLSGGNLTAQFQVEVSGTIPMYTLVAFDFEAASGNLAISNQYYQLIGVNVEDFETGDFTSYNWVQGDHPWTITNESPYEGAYSSKSGAIDNGQTSQLNITMEVLGNDSISFYSRVSSESSFDFLRFFIGQQEKENWSGEVPWAHHSYPVSAGLNTFTWKYTKDFYGVEGSDCAWVDYIVFPAFRNNTGMPDAEVAGFDLVVYPNPASKIMHMKATLKNDGNYLLSVIAADGRLCFQQNINGTAETMIDVSTFKPGYYQCVLSDGVVRLSRPILIR